MWKNVVLLGGTQMTVWHVHCMPRNTLLEYVILLLCHCSNGFYEHASVTLCVLFNICSIFTL